MAFTISPQLRAHLSRGLFVGGRVASVAVHLTSGTTALGKAGALLGVAEAVLGQTTTLAQEASVLRRLTTRVPVQRAIMAQLRSNNTLLPGRTRQKETEWYLPVGEGRLLWVMSEEQAQASPAALDNLGPEEAWATLGRAAWEALGPRITSETKRWGDIATIARDDLANCASSALATETATRLKKYNAKGKHRALLFTGPPGTGKSFLMREVARLMGGFCLRHTCTYGSDKILPDLVAVLRPTCVVIDDIDRQATSSMLDAVELIKEDVPVVLASANFKERMDPAMRRPGRFDRVVVVETLDPAAIDKLVGDVPDDERAIVSKLPAAYINEYHEVREVEGPEAGTVRLAELVTLCAEITEAGDKAVTTTEGKK